MKKMTRFRLVELSDETSEEGAKKRGNKLSKQAPKKSFQRELLKNEIFYFIGDSNNENERNQAS